MSTDIRQQLITLVEQTLQGTPRFLIDVVVSLRRQPVKILIVMDGDQGVTIDDCAELSRSVNNAIIAGNWVEGDYTLEVTTPGLEQPLRLDRQYARNVGRGVKVHLKSGEVIHGKLTAFADGLLTLQSETREGKKKVIVTEKQLSLQEIEKTLVTVSFK
ncbi:MAG: ribosome maturation factor RimP [Cyclobacteriaceae bacterium]|nr:ribosome maturation factor RimP [Cyclobacteriaceae bacterium]